MKIIVAACKNLGIGFQYKLPWHFKNELKYFKNLTIGEGNNAIIMGSNTWNSLPIKPLQNRFNCILSTSLNVNKTNTKVFNNMNDLIYFTKKEKFDDVWVIGGEKIYNTFLDNDLINTIYLTKIDKNFICDTYFNIPPNFNVIESSRLKAEKDITYNHLILEKETDLS